MAERLAELIHEYQDRVFEAVKLFEKNKGITQEELMYAWHNGLSNEGFLDSEQSIEYYFHGIGCCVIFPNREVDWDFGYGGRIDGFDAWRLWVFAKEGTENFLEFRQKEILEIAFNEAIVKGVIYKQFKGFQDKLYYLVSK